MPEWLRALLCIAIFIVLLLTGIGIFNLAQQIYNAPTITKQPIIITPDTIDVQSSADHRHWDITGTFDNITLKGGEMYYIRFMLPVVDREIRIDNEKE
ncbi:MAG: hypothetical protein WC516_08450 [Patescibacteria group bacterium]|jgi:hypothetical protein